MATTTTSRVYIPIDERPPETVRAVIWARTSDPGAKAQKVESQVDACREFIREMGWPEVAEPVVERKSGYRRVKRPALQELEGIIQRREIDVIVTTELERISRQPGKQQSVIEYATSRGVAWRFLEFKPDGKLPDSVQWQAYLFARQFQGRLERERTVERTQRGRDTKAKKRIPSGGRDGAPYGYDYVFPEVTGHESHSHTSFSVNEKEAETLRWLFKQIDEHPDESIRSLVRQLNDPTSPHHARTRRDAAWSIKTVMDKLRNPLYCGKGQVLMFQTTWSTLQDSETGEVYEAAQQVKRPSEECLPVAEGTVPAIVDQALFDRVQKQLAERRWFVGRLERANSPHKADNTLLHGGFVRCAHCGAAMSRYWHAPKGKKTVVHYRCEQSGGNPLHPCKAHAIPAATVDRIVRHRLAFALTDPEQVAAIADASEPHYQQALADGERARARKQEIKDQLQKLEKDRKVYQQHHADLTQMGNQQLAGAYESLLRDMATEQEHLTEELEALRPQQTRAERRAALLHALTEQEGKIRFNFLEGTMKFIPVGERRPRTELDAATALGLLGQPSPGEQWNKRMRELGKPELPLDVAEEVSERYLRETEQWYIPTKEVTEELLEQMPLEALRQLLRDLHVVVKVSRPAGRPSGHLTPANKRVVVEIFSDDKGAALQVGADGTNGVSITPDVSSLDH